MWSETNHKWASWIGKRENEGVRVWELELLDKHMFVVLNTRALELQAAYCLVDYYYSSSSSKHY